MVVGVNGRRLPEHVMDGTILFRDLVASRSLRTSVSTFWNCQSNSRASDFQSRIRATSVGNSPGEGARTLATRH